MAGTEMVKAVFVVGFVVAVISVWAAGRVCCPAIRGLDSQVKATPDRQAVCNCLKTQAESYGVKLAKAVNLPGLCKVTDLNVPVNPNVDCSKVH